MTNLKPYTVLKNKHVGETCFVIGAGPSLYGFYKHPDRDKIFKHVVITTNSGIFALPFGCPHPNAEVTYEADSDPDKRYFISCDSLLRRWSFWNYVKSHHCHCIKIVRDSWHEYFNEIPNFLTFSIRPTPEHIVEAEDDGKGLCYCSSIPSAIDLSLFMQCRKIILIGVDQQKIQNHTHWFDFLDRKMQPRRLDGNYMRAPWEQQMMTFQYNILAYKALKSYAEKKGVEILNANLTSAVDIFPKINLNDILKLISLK